MKQKIKKLKPYFPQSGRDFTIFLMIMFITSWLCFVLKDISDTDFHVPMIFVLAVLVVSLLTNGYFYGIFAALLSVFAVNWAFTYPYFEMNFSIYGYPLTFLTMLAVGIATSTLATRTKEQDKLKRETEQEKMRANLLRAISHDLRTPLTTISGSIAAVLENDDILSEEEKTLLLADAKKDSDWLCRMVENLLSITRISGDEIKRIKKEDEILEEVVSEAVFKFKSKNPLVDILVSVPDELMFVPMDAMLIEQVLLNLLDNAVSHGKTTTRIRVSAVQGTEFASIIVSDDGQGIQEEALNHLFDGKLQINDSADKTRSMGIGLMVCRTIVEAHGGTIYAENLPGGGASFVFTLKLGAK